MQGVNVSVERANSYYTLVGAVPVRGPDGRVSHVDTAELKEVKTYRHSS